MVDHPEFTIGPNATRLPELHNGEYMIFSPVTKTILPNRFASFSTGVSVNKWPENSVGIVRQGGNYACRGKSRIRHVVQKMCWVSSLIFFTMATGGAALVSAM